MPVNGIPKHLVKQLTRAKFEQLADSLINRTIEPCKSALKMQVYQLLILMKLF